jgi:hypothetical protein
MEVYTGWDELKKKRLKELIYLFNSLFTYTFDTVCCKHVAWGLNNHNLSNIERKKEK